MKAFFSKIWTWILAHKIIAIVVASVLAVGTTCAIVLPIALHGHSYATEWSSDAENHWHAATCKHDEEKSDLAAHTYTNACDTACDVCGYTRTVGAHVYDNACDTTCNVCGATREITHAHSTTYSTNETQHWKDCTVCGYDLMVANHVYDQEVESDDYYVSNDLTTITYNKSCVCGAKGTETFTVDKESATLTVNVSDKVYDGQLATIDIQTNSTGTQAKYFYKWNDETDNWDMLNEALTKNAGNYKVQVIVYADDTYKATEVEEEFEVTQKVLSLPSMVEKTYDGTNVVEYNFDATTTGTGEAVTVKVGLMEGSGYTPIKNVGTYTVDFDGYFQFDEPHFFVGGNEVENYDLDSAFWGQTGEYEITINKKVIGNFTYNTTYQADATTNGIILTLTATHGVANGEYLFIKIDAEDIFDYEAGQTYDLVLSESDAGNGKLVAYLSATNDNYTVDIETIKLRVS